MKKLTKILSALSLLALLFAGFACSGAADDPGAAITVQAATAFSNVSAAIGGAQDVLTAGTPVVTGVVTTTTYTDGSTTVVDTFNTVTYAETVVFSFVDYVDPLSGDTINGNLTMSYSLSGSIMSEKLSGSLTISGGGIGVSTFAMNVTMNVNMDAMTMTSNGSITVDGVKYDMSGYADISGPNIVKNWIKK